MALKEELKEQEKNCIEVKDFVNLALKALEEPSDIAYAKELLGSAEEECKFPDDYVAIAEVYVKLNEINKAEELYETAEENAFEPLEFAKIAHSIFLYLGNADKSLELYKSSIKEAKKIQDLIDILNLIQSDFPENEIINEISNKISSSIKNVEDFKKILSEILTKSKTIADKIAKEYEKKVDGLEQIVQFATVLNELLSEKEWAKQLLEDGVEDAKFTKEFISLAKGFNSLGETEKSIELLQQAKDYAISPEENLELAFALWELQKEKNLVSSLLQKSYKSIKDRTKITELIIFSKENLQNPELAKEILSYLINNPLSNDDLLKNIIMGFKVLNDPSFTAQNFNQALQVINDPKDLVSFGIEYFNILGNKTHAKEFFEKALMNSTKFEQFIDIAKRYYNIIGSDEFLSNCLKACEKSASITNEYIELAQIYFETLKDLENSRKCLETAEEIVASLQDIKAVVDNVKKLFPDDENWHKRVEDKLKKREANQSKYDSLLKLEKDAKYLKDYLGLVDKVMEELDDVYYAKKLLNKAIDLLDNQYLNIENYYKLCQSILKTTKDTDWVENILNSLYHNKILFISDLNQLLHYVQILLPDKEKVKVMAETFINGWKRKIKDLNDALKLAILMQNYNFPKTEIENFFAEFSKNQSEFENLYVLLDFSLKYEYDNFANSILKKIWEAVKNSNQFISLIKLLLNYNFKSEELNLKYFEFAKKVENFEEILVLAENYSKLFGKNNLDNFIKLSKSKFGNRSEIFEKIHNIILEEKYW